MKGGTALSAAVALIGGALLAGSAGCLGRSGPDWPAIHAAIRADFPGVPHITTVALDSLLAGGSPPILLDVRAEEEYAVSHLEGALWCADEEAAGRHLRETAPGAPIVAYCSVGYRSAALVEALRRRGFTAARNLEGSLFRWANEGRPVIREGEPVSEVHPYDRKWGKLLDQRYHPAGSPPGAPRKR